MNVLLKLHGRFTIFPLPLPSEFTASAGSIPNVGNGFFRKRTAGGSAIDDETGRFAVISVREGLFGLFFAAVLILTVTAFRIPMGESSPTVAPVSPISSEVAGESTETPIVTTDHPLNGRIIALDAGHGGLDSGAWGYCDDVQVTEAEVNLRVRELLQQQLIDAGATVFLVPQLPGRLERVEAAEQAGGEILLSIHHNGFDDPDLNHTKTFVTQTNDERLASFIHPELIRKLGLEDAGIERGALGMTYYGSIPGVLTEASFITNPVEACNFTGIQSRVRDEVIALFNGILTYFAAVDAGEV